MTEADFEREAVKLFKQLGLKVGAESLDFFKGQSVLLSDWKSLFKHPQQPRSRMSSSSTATRESIMSSSPHHRRVQPLVLPTASLGINSRGSTSPTSHDSTDHEEEDDRDSEEEYFGDCAVCEQPVIGDETGCLALDQVFHNMCFKCNKCYKPLSGGSFFVSDGLVLCEKDYLFTLDKCYTCKQVITHKIIRAIGHTYHPVCFRCNVCGLCLDGVPFAADFSNNVYCEKDFHKMFAPICAVCQDPIVPSPGKNKSKRLIAMNLSFHVDCYRCLECNIPLVSNQCSSSAVQCYPINEHPLCLQCNKLWSSRGQTKLEAPLPYTCK